MLACARDSTTQSLRAASVPGGTAGSSGRARLGIVERLRQGAPVSSPPVKITQEIVPHPGYRAALDPDGGAFSPEVGAVPRPAAGLRLPLVDHFVEQGF